MWWCRWVLNFRHLLTTKVFTFKQLQQSIHLKCKFVQLISASENEALCKKITAIPKELHFYSKTLELRLKVCTLRTS